MCDVRAGGLSGAFSGTTPAVCRPLLVSIWVYHDILLVIPASNGTALVPVPYQILSGGKILVHPQALTTNKATIRLNADASTCFLYGSESKLPAPPVEMPV